MVVIELLAVRIVVHTILIGIIVICIFYSGAYCTYRVAHSANVAAYCANTVFYCIDRANHSIESSASCIDHSTFVLAVECIE